MINNKEVTKLRQDLNMHDHLINSLQTETNQDRLKIIENTESLTALDKNLTQFKVSIEKKITKFTPLPLFETEIKKVADTSRRFNYCCKDLDNKIKTTDRYIDQFLPFRMIKEVSSFMEFLLPEEQAMKIKILKKEKIKELYHKMFNLEEVAGFKDAMKKLQREANETAFGGKAQPRDEPDIISEQDVESEGDY